VVAELCEEEVYGEEFVREKGWIGYYVDGTGREDLIGLDGWHNRRGKSTMRLTDMETVGKKYAWG